MLAIEEMQSHERARNGIKERVIGYVGKDWEPELEELDMTSFAEAGFKSTDYKDLPTDIQFIIEAENHRLKTGEVLTVEAYRKQKGGDN